MMEAGNGNLGSSSGTAENLAEPAFEAFKESGECPDCGDEDPHPGLYYAACCGRQFCWDCYWRKHEKFT
jgi:hypothetical protein